MDLSGENVSQNNYILIVFITITSTWKNSNWGWWQSLPEIISGFVSSHILRHVIVAMEAFMFTVQDKPKVVLWVILLYHFSNLLWSVQPIFS